MLPKFRSCSPFAFAASSSLLNAEKSRVDESCRCVLIYLAKGELLVCINLLGKGGKCCPNFVFTCSPFAFDSSSLLNAEQSRGADNIMPTITADSSLKEKMNETSSSSSSSSSDAELIQEAAKTVLSVKNKTVSTINDIKRHDAILMQHRRFTEPCIAVVIKVNAEANTLDVHYLVDKNQSKSVSFDNFIGFISSIEAKKRFQLDACYMCHGKGMSIIFF